LYDALLSFSICMGYVGWVGGGGVSKDIGQF